MLDRNALKTVFSDLSQGDEAALRQLYQGRSGVLYALAFRILKDSDRAAEALKQTFAQVWQLARTGKANWEMPDLEIARICREVSGQAARLSPAQPGDDLAFAMSDPVKTGNATFELLALLQALGSMSPESRNAITVAYFDCPSREDLAAQLSLAPDDLTIYLRRCYAEYVEAGNANPIGIDRETDLIAMIQALGLTSHPEGSSDDPLRHVWELRIAPLAELLEPVPAPEGTLEDILVRVKAGAGPTKAKKPGRSPEVKRAAIVVAVAAVAAIVIYFGLVALDIGTATQSGSTVQENN